ncbi:MAG: hypothetical protein JO001_16080 [Alphaproteobacteria bacterium]|nr:hypothetical protein [Alphaproteobacteria bacterium]
MATRIDILREIEGLFGLDEPLVQAKRDYDPAAYWQEISELAASHAADHRVPDQDEEELPFGPRWRRERLADSDGTTSL